MALSIGSWDLQFRPWGWARLQEQDGGPTVFVQYQRSGPAGQERFDMQSVVMKAGDESLSGRVWRRIPLADLETYFVFPEVRDVLTSESEVAPPSLEELEEYFTATENSSKVSAITWSGMYVSDGSEGYPEGKFPMIHAPEGRLTDEFLADVADAYRWLTRAKRAPAPAIADMAKVPVRTVHRWIYEARKRDILPPARQGRAG